MKKVCCHLMFAGVLVLLLSFLVEVKAQTGYTYTPWRETDVLPNGQPRPLDFMTLGDQNHTYVKCAYGNSHTDYNSHQGTTGSGTTASHSIITTSGNDPCRCYQNGSQYTHENFLPPSWDGVPGHTQDKVVRIGCYGCHSCQCTQAQEIEYWFYPPKDSSTLLVYFSFSQENAPHSASSNPRFYIEVLDAQTGSLIPSGYYKRCNGSTNNQWPYSRFLAVPSGTNSNQNTSCTDPDGGPMTFYYWAYPESTPTTFPYRVCPRNQTGGLSYEDVHWFEYKPLAFDLSSYANQNRAVKLRIRARACDPDYHWAYGMFAAKLIPGFISVDACGDDLVTMSVPWGFLEDTYEWHYGTDSAHSNNIIEAYDRPGVTGTTYKLILDPSITRIYPYYRCEMKSYTGAPFTYEAYIKKYDIQPDFSYFQVNDEDFPCSYLIQLQNTGKVYELTPKVNEAGYDTTFQTSGYHLHWYYKNSAGVYQTLSGSENVDDPIFNISNTADIDLQNFNFEPGGDSIMIKLVVQDSLQKCIDSIELNIGLDTSFVTEGTSKDTVFACNNQLPFFYEREKYGDAYRWDAPGTKECHVGEDFNDLSWNGCDSIVTVTLEVMNPKIEILDLGDYCDSFKTTLMVAPLPGQPFSQDDIHVLNWNGDESSTGTRFLAEHAGVYTLDAEVGDAGCAASASYKISACMPFVNLPNTITPSNHDGVNDCFEIPQKSLVKSLEFTVFNRNGSVVFQTTDVNFKWRGARFSEDYPEMEYCNQTYVYTLKMVDYNGKPYPVIKGTILVL